MSILYLVDNSVIQRLHRSPEVRSARDALMRTGDLAVCLPTVLEACCSARSSQEHQREADAYMTAWTVLEPAPEVMGIALLLQSKLFNAGKGRSVGVAHYDADFDHLQSVEPSLRTQWVVPRGTVA